MQFIDHIDHIWVEAGDCVYCKSCSIRLYQGKLPKDIKARKGFLEALDQITAEAFEPLPKQRSKDYGKVNLD